MLLRSSSSPMLKCLIPVSTDTGPPSPNHLHVAPRNTLTRAVSESDISGLLPHPISKRKQRAMVSETTEKKSTVKEPSSLGRHRSLLSNSGLDLQVRQLTPSRADHVMVVDDGYVGSGGSGGKVCGGGGNGGFFSDPNRNADVYYQEMIHENPSDPLVLGNYAKYLKEVRGDLGKAEEYCERSLLANQGDANMLSMYAGIIWERSKDVERAETYFDRAVQAAPQDCYVMASYARFLWDADEDEEEDKKRQQKEEEAVGAAWSQPQFFPGQATRNQAIITSVS